MARPVEREEAEAAVEDEEEEELFQIPEADNIGQLAPRPCIDQELLSLPLQGMHW